MGSPRSYKLAGELWHLTPNTQYGFAVQQYFKRERNARWSI